MILDCCLVVLVLLIATIVVILWDQKVVYLGGWRHVPHTLFGTDTITKLREGLWIITSPGNFNPGTNIYGTAPDNSGHIKLWCGDAGLWSPSRVRAVKQLMYQQDVTTLSDFIISHPHPDHIGGLPELLQLAGSYARIFTSIEDSWQLTEPCGSPNLPERMHSILAKVGTPYLDWPLNRLYWMYPFYAWNVFGSGACGIDRNRFQPIGERNIFRFNGYYLCTFQRGGHTPGELMFVAVPDDERNETIVLAADVIDLTNTERQLITPMPLPEGRFVGMADVLAWILEKQPAILVAEHGGIIRGRDNIATHIDRVLIESNRVIDAVKLGWPTRRYEKDFRSFAVSVFKHLGYKPTTTLTCEEMTSIVASIGIELNL